MVGIVADAFVEPRHRHLNCHSAAEPGMKRGGDIRRREAVTSVPSLHPAIEEARTARVLASHGPQGRRKMRDTRPAFGTTNVPGLSSPGRGPQPRIRLVAQRTRRTGVEPVLDQPE